MKTTSAIPAGVNHDALLVDIFAEKVGVDGAVACIVHRFNVHVAKTTVRPPVNISGTTLYPAAIEQIVHLPGAYRQHYLFPTLARSGVGKSDKGLFAAYVIK